MAAAIAEPTFPFLGGRNDVIFIMAKFEVTDCGICLEGIVDAYALDCGHMFCRGCINAYKKYGVNDVCPYCRAPLPPGFEYSFGQCLQMYARILRYKADGDMKRVNVAQRLQLHHAQKAVKADPNHTIAHFYLAVGLERVNNDIDGAINEYREALRCDQNDTESHYNLGVLLENVRKDYDSAEHEYREAIRCNPNYAMAHGNLGSLLMCVRKDYDGAERGSREALRCDPNDAHAHANLGILLMCVHNDYGGAERELREAIRCDPNHTEALAALK
jgi:Flp pilus assembly protein TadD